MDSVSMVEATGWYKFKINHAKTKHMGIGEKILLPTFRVGEHDWRVVYFPRGLPNNEHNGRYNSVGIWLQGVTLNVTANVEFGLLSKEGDISPATVKGGSHKFTTHKTLHAVEQFVKTTQVEESHVVDSQFVLTVKIAVKNEPHTCAYSFPHERLQMLWKEGKYIDVSFNVDGQIFFGNKVMIAAYSPVFAASFFGSMAISGEEPIIVREIAPSVFKSMIEFISSGSLTVNEEVMDCDGTESSTTFLQQLLIAADRYSIESLTHICQLELANRTCFDTVISNLQLAEQFNFPSLKQKCIKFLVDKGNSVSLFIDESYVMKMIEEPSRLVYLRKLVEIEK